MTAEVVRGKYLARGTWTVFGDKDAVFGHITREKAVEIAEEAKSRGLIISYEVEESPDGTGKIVCVMMLNYEPDKFTWATLEQP